MRDVIAAVCCLHLDKKRAARMSRSFLPVIGRYGQGCRKPSYPR
jgi:hypothetical protein